MVTTLKILLLLAALRGLYEATQDQPKQKPQDVLPHGQQTAQAEQQRQPDARWDPPLSER